MQIIRFVASSSLLIAILGAYGCQGNAGAGASQSAEESSFQQYRAEHVRSGSGGSR